MSFSWQKLIPMAACLVISLRYAAGQTGAVGPSKTPGFHAIPIQSYAAIDISGTAAVDGQTPVDVTMVALDDSNRAAFLFPTGSSSADGYNFTCAFYHSFTWINGAATEVTATPGNEFLNIDPSSLSTSWYSRSPADLTSQGDVYFNEDTMLTGLNDSFSYPYYWGDVCLTTHGASGVVSNSPTHILDPSYQPTTDIPNDSYFSACTFSNGTSNGTFSGVACGTALDVTGSISGVHEVLFLYTSGTWTNFDSNLYTGNLPANVKDQQFNFTPSVLNDRGSVAGSYNSSATPYFLAMSSTTPLSISPLYSLAAMNNSEQIVGTGGTNGLIWTSSSTLPVCSLVQPGNTQTILSLLPQQFQTQLTSINPITLNNTNSIDGSVCILSNALYQTDPNSPAVGAGWSLGTFLLTLETGTQTDLRQVSVPTNVNVNLNSGSINANGIIADLGTMTTGTTTSAQKALLLLPEDLIQVDAFIPQTWVYEPPLAIFADSGNSRKNPLDASLTSGSAIFIQNSPEFKVRQTLNVCSYSYYDPDGSLEEATKQTKVGGTREYRAGQLVNGEIPANAVPNASGTATPSIDDVTVDHLSQGVVAATFEMQVSNPIAIGASLAPIEYNITVKIDRSNPSQPVYTVFGSNCEFPAYEIYINGQQVYHYDPIPAGDGPADLLWGMTQSFNNTGPLDH